MRDATQAPTTSPIGSNNEAMSPMRDRPFIFAAYVAAMLIFGCGCRTSAHFRVVDAETGRPMAGVAVKQWSQVQDMLFGSH